MASMAHFNRPAASTLLSLPTELLFEIASCLATPELRLFGRVNRKFRSFVDEYLRRYRYSKGLFRLPKEFVLRVAQHLNSQADRSRLARTTQKWYPLITNYIAQNDLLHGLPSLLVYAAKKDLRGMARKIINLGGDVNCQETERLTRHKIDYYPYFRAQSPLSIAAHHGHEDMVLLLLKAGASRLVNGHQRALAAAIRQRHEKTALMLSKDLEANDIIDMARWGFPHPSESPTAMYVSCEARFAKLVEQLLARGERRCTQEQSIQNQTASLHQVLEMTASRDWFFKNEFMDDVYQIVSMLLSHQANPDESICGYTAREIARKHPDPRVRNLLVPPDLPPRDFWAQKPASVLQPTPAPVRKAKRP
jgi:ankyrin repeat protein